MALTDAGGSERVESVKLVSLFHEGLHQIDTTYRLHLFDGDKGEARLNVLCEAVAALFVDNGWIECE